MKFIVKQQEPQAWRSYKNTPGVEFQAIPELKKSLLEEQGHLCCYCMSQITSENMRVEHYKPRRFVESIMDYANLFAVCTGDFCSDKHCDNRKDNDELMIHPADPRNNCEKIIGYSSNGKLLYPPAYQRDIEDILNLNNSVLVSNRKEAIFGAVLVMKKNNFKADLIRKKIKEFSSKDENMRFKPYCKAVLWLLHKKLKSN